MVTLFAMLASQWLLNMTYGAVLILNEKHNIVIIVAVIILFLDVVHLNLAGQIVFILISILVLINSIAEIIGFVNVLNMDLFVNDIVFIHVVLQIKPTINILTFNSCRWFHLIFSICHYVILVVLVIHLLVIFGYHV